MFYKKHQSNFLFFLASFEGKIDAIRLLCEHDANVNSKLSNGCTALHIAAFYGHASVVKCLSESGAKIDEKNNDGATPFFIG